MSVLDPTQPVSSSSSSLPFPDFFTRDSGVEAPLTVPSARRAALMVQAARNVGSRQGLLFAVPIPKVAEPAGQQIQEVREHAWRAF